jgi:CRP-like cAMP-binding protein
LLNAIAIRLRKADKIKQDFQNNLQGMNELLALNGGDNYLAALKEGRSENHYKKKQVVYVEGNHPSRLYYLVKGKLKTYKRNEDGKELIVGLYNEGDFVGYMPLLEGGVYKESAEALEDAVLAIIPRSEFETLLSSNAAVMRKFIGILAKNIDEKEAQLLALAYNSLRKKVADTLVLLHQKYNAQQHPDFIIDLSRENLAAIAGVAKESLIRMLSELKSENIIQIEGSKIKIIALPKLEQMFN